MTVGLERAYHTPLANSPLLPLLLLSLTKQRHTPEGSYKIRKEYDYVIVGGGTAGSVLASRLSQKPCVSVLVLEAGPKPPLLTEVPALGRYFWFTDVDWQYKTAPQKYTGKALVNRQVVWPSGKMLGGSSSLNGMWYVRGNKKNYDDWAAHGAKGWSFRDVFPYFLKMENNKDEEFLIHGYHTRGGPTTVHQPRYEPELKHAIEEAALSLGYKVVDSNAARQTGFYDHQATLRYSQRCSTAKSYLVPAENRTNLDILPNARVKKLIIQNHKAEGVRFAFGRHTYVVKARKEIILSAGTVNTAQLLMLSGIGPKKELQRLNIDVIEDLPVGQNLHDHGGTHIPYVLDSYIQDFEEKISDPDSIKQYVHNRTGPLASTIGVNYLAFLNSESVYHRKDFPSYQLYFSEMTSSMAKEQIGLRSEVYHKLYGPYEDKPLFMCTVSLLQPKSRGKVSLRSKNPYDPPIIDPNYLADSRDVEDLLQGMKTCQRIAKSRPLWKLRATPFRTAIPGCEKFSDDEDEYFKCHLRSIFVTLHDPVGTVKMGEQWDPTTVVDSKLRVKNVKGLRVVDASIMPIIPSGNTNIPTIMIAEKASDIIKETIDCYKTDEDYWNEPEESPVWPDYDEDWLEEQHWKGDEDPDEIWIDHEHWKKSKDKETVWIEEGESWENPKDTVWADEEKWEDSHDKETTWENKDEWDGNKENIWTEDEKPLTKPKDKETWSEYVYTTAPQHQWSKPHKETTWENKDKWDGNKENIWIEDEKPLTKPKDKETWSEYVYTTAPQHQWSKPHKETTWENKDKWDGNKENIWIEDEKPLTKPKDKETWSEHVYTTAPQHQWSKPHKESWSNTDPHHILSSHPKWKNEKAESYVTESSEGLLDYGVTKSIDELVKEAEMNKYEKVGIISKDYNSPGMKESVYDHVKEIKSEYYPKTDNTWAHLTDYKRAKFNVTENEKTHESWTEPTNFKTSASIDDLIRQAKESSQRKSAKANDYEVSKSTDELLQLAKSKPDIPLFKNSKLSFY